MYIESEIKCVATGDRAYAFWDGFENRGEVIAVLKMWRIWRFYNLMMMICDLKPRVGYLTSGSIHVCRRLRSSCNRYLTVILMFVDTEL
ncbi:hypothetical protein HID58_022771 [Brassica napus]|uniref:Uncharacterized protein n=1 Tax=Brassica napus TaxID=3708 RepID=A0ABQ8D081_BRANA|nr:hypothetical protein HID58_022771 [Brassica napus]